MTIHRVVCLPYADGQKIKTLLTLRPIAGGDDFCFEHKRGDRAFRVGHVYDLEQTEDGKFKLKAASYVGPFDDKEQAAQWEAAEEARRIVKAAESREAKSKGALSDPLAVIRNARHALPPPHRLAFDLWLLNEIRRV